jgi:hypothetical protein
LCSFYKCLSISTPAVSKLAEFKLACFQQEGQEASVLRKASLNDLHGQVSVISHTGAPAQGLCANGFEAGPGWWHEALQQGNP